MTTFAYDEVLEDSFFTHLESLVLYFNDKHHLDNGSLFIDFDS